MSEVKVLTETERLQEENAKLRHQVMELRSDAAMAQLPEVPQYKWQGKIARQSSALTRLNKRVRLQRLILRELNEMDPQLAYDIFTIVKDKYATELDPEFVLTV